MSQSTNYKPEEFLQIQKRLLDGETPYVQLNTNWQTSDLAGSTAKVKKILWFGNIPSKAGLKKKFYYKSDDFIENKLKYRNITSLFEAVAIKDAESGYPSPHTSLNLKLLDLHKAETESETIDNLLNKLDHEALNEMIRLFQPELVLEWDDKKNHKTTKTFNYCAFQYLLDYTGPTTWTRVSREDKIAAVADVKYYDRYDTELTEGANVIYLNTRYGSGASICFGRLKEIKMKASEHSRTAQPQFIIECTDWRVNKRERNGRQQSKLNNASEIIVIDKFEDLINFNSEFNIHAEATDN